MQTNNFTTHTESLHPQGMMEAGEENFPSWFIQLVIMWTIQSKRRRPQECRWHQLFLLLLLVTLAFPPTHSQRPEGNEAEGKKTEEAAVQFFQKRRRGEELEDLCY